MRRLFFALLTLCLLPLTAVAQAPDRANTILVLDGSGSMWGQIDGINKIVIAREVIADLLADMPDDQSLGLTVYGHRQRGSCTDIETIVAPAPFTQDAILSAVNAINPRGRTPMTDAVVAAAQSLRHTEEPATVILVSDGIENCNPDPCAMAAELEAAGIGFTAHVIGFDVASEPEARAQMQCIADNTGGLFLTADNAAELSAALQQVTMAPVAPAVTPSPIRIEARLTPSGAVPTRAIGWTLLAASGEVLATGTQGPAISAELMPGDYVARATRAEADGPVTYQTAFAVTQGMQGPVIVSMPEIVDTVPVTFTARVEPDMTVPASPLIWSLFDANEQELLGPVEAPGGNVALLPGDYRLSVTRVTQETTHDARFTVAANTPQEVIIPLPALMVDVTLSARIGGASGPVITDPVLWQIDGLDAPMDAANPYTIGLTRGAYRVTAYWTAQEIEQSADFVIVDQPREIAVIFPEPRASATLTGPQAGVAGATVEIGWTGPGDDGDWIGFYPEGMTSTHAYDAITRVGIEAGQDTVRLRLPPRPGRYQLRYTAEEGRDVLASMMVEVTPASASLTTGQTGIAGATVDIGWTGVGYDGDWIGFYPEGMDSTHAYDAITRVGIEAGRTSVALRLPPQPGRYELRYTMELGRVVLATMMVDVTAASATLTAPEMVAIADTVEIGWTGPGYADDWIGFYPEGMDSTHAYDATTRAGITAGEATLRLTAPTEPGRYELRYTMGLGRVVLARTIVEVTETAASLTAPANAIAGSMIEVGWTGPDHPDDYIGIGRADGQGSAWANYVYTRDGNPVSLLVPAEPGAYLIQYFLNADRTSIASVPITVSEAAASITAPASAIAGTTIEVGWTGPDYRDDYIGIGRADGQGSGWANYAYTRDGSPAQIVVPPEPGDYLIQYFVAQDRTPIASSRIVVTAAEASLTAPASAVAGQTIEVGWTGPNYRDDYIGIGRADGRGSAWANYAYTRDGSPAQLLMPPEGGDYVIRYFIAQDRTPIAEVPITLTPVAASLTAPATAQAGSVIEIGWTGPDYGDDYIGIGRADGQGSQWAEYVYTRDGSPARLTLPDTPGAYVIRYFVAQDRTPVAEVPITLQ